MNKSLTPSLLAWLRSFNSVASHGSFTKAAQDLQVTQASISQQVKQLEGFLKTPLFIRHTRFLELTPEGNHLFAVSSQSFGEISRAVDKIKRKHDNEFISLSCSPSFALTWITPRIKTLIQHSPDIRVSVKGEFHSINTKQTLASEEFVTAIRYDPYQYNNAHDCTFLDEYLIPVCSPAFLKAHQHIDFTQRIPPDLMLHDAEPWDGAQPHTEWDYWLEHAQYTPVEEHTGVSFNLSILAVTAAISAQGIAMGRLSLVIDYLRQGVLVPLIAKPIISPASYHFLTSHEYEQHPVIQKLSKWLIHQGKLFKQEREHLLDTSF